MRIRHSRKYLWINSRLYQAKNTVYKDSRRVVVVQPVMETLKILMIHDWVKLCCWSQSLSRIPKWSMLVRLSGSQFRCRKGLSLGKILSGSPQEG